MPNLAYSQQFGIAHSPHPRAVGGTLLGLSTTETISHRRRALVSPVARPSLLFHDWGSTFCSFLIRWIVERVSSMQCIALELWRAVDFCQQQAEPC